MYSLICKDDEFVKEVKRLIVLKCAQPDSSQSTPSSTAATTRTKTLNAIQTFFNKCEYVFSSEEMSSDRTTTATIQQEIASYVSLVNKATEFQQFWRNHYRQLPRLASLVRRYCILPATSVACESAFSIAGFIQRKQRSSLAPSALRYLMLLRESDLIKNLAQELENM